MEGIQQVLNSLMDKISRLENQQQVRNKDNHKHRNGRQYNNRNGRQNKQHKGEHQYERHTHGRRNGRQNNGENGRPKKHNGGNGRQNNRENGRQNEPNGVYWSNNEDFKPMLKTLFKCSQVRHHLRNWSELPYPIDNRISEIFGFLSPPAPNEILKKDLHHTAGRWKKELQ